jgi:hypothetical protein
MLHAICRPDRETGVTAEIVERPPILDRVRRVYQNMPVTRPLVVNAALRATGFVFFSDHADKNILVATSSQMPKNTTESAVRTSLPIVQCMLNGMVVPNRSNDGAGQVLDPDDHDIAETVDISGPFDTVV